MATGRLRGLIVLEPVTVPDCSRLKACCAIVLGGWLTFTQADEIPRSDSPARPAVDLEHTTARKPGVGGLIGLSATSAAEYLGSDRRDFVVRPLAAFRYGRFRFSTSGSGGLIDFGTDTEASGVSLDLVQSSHWKLRTGLRLTGGRSSSDSGNLAGIPDVRRTALGRASVTYVLSRYWSVGTTLNADVLGRGSGLFATTGLTYRHPVGHGAELQAGAGFTLANATHLESYYGVPESAATPGRPAYSPSAGLKDAGVGVTLTSVLASHWVGFAGLRYTRLLGDAADSPLTLDRSDVAATVGIAWRCCR